MPKWHCRKDFFCSTAATHSIQVSKSFSLSGYLCFSFTSIWGLKRDDKITVGVLERRFKILQVYHAGHMTEKCEGVTGLERVSLCCVELCSTGFSITSNMPDRILLIYYRNILNK